MAQVIDISFTLNGKECKLSVPANAVLLDVIRDKMYLTGTKEGCGRGECGACTILFNGRSVNACLILALQADGAEIVTIEGAGVEKKLPSIQKAFVEEGAVQCGFCTPGMIMSSLYLLNKNPNPSIAEIREGISGNLCRCTGYVKIIKAVEKAGKDIGK
jgi:carbon-monoxide dehydrogenase small subunit